MEAFHLLRLILWLDDLGLRPLSRWVPDLPRLLDSPAQAFQVQKIEIGPWRHYVKIGVILVGLAFAGLSASHEITSRTLLICLISALLLLAGSVIYALRGGRCILHSAGVDFYCRGVTVFCPWELFKTDGHAIYYPDARQLALPVAPSAISRVEVRRNESLAVHALDARVTHVLFIPTGEIHLKFIYGVKPEELGNFILELSRKLGTRSAPIKSGVGPVSAQREPGGWIRVSLTRLQFPPLCCDCGKVTDRWQEFVGDPSFFGGTVSLTPAEQSVRIKAPVCGHCWRANRRHYWWILLKTTLLAVIGTTVLGFLLGLILDLVGLTPDRGLMTFIMTISALFGSLGLSWFITSRHAHTVSAPLCLSDYRSRDGAIRVRFRNAEYADVFLGAMGAN